MTATNAQSQSSPDIMRLVDESLAQIREALCGLRYGTVSLTVHEGRVIQIDVTEKRRLQQH